ncbi:hypothetical protein B0H10DRAFT_2227870 [Mycena sp. CBHHK59/15]|nr:hypothetical protein B0H10DRAFT_2227870 [Mycena sp. CBHHK59/15]
MAPKKALKDTAPPTVPLEQQWDAARVVIDPPSSPLTAGRAPPAPPMVNTYSPPVTCRWGRETTVCPSPSAEPGTSPAMPTPAGKRRNKAFDFDADGFDADSFDAALAPMRIPLPMWEPVAPGHPLHSRPAPACTPANPVAASLDLHPLSARPLPFFNSSDFHPPFRYTLMASNVLAPASANVGGFLPPGVVGRARGRSPPHQTAVGLLYWLKGCRLRHPPPGWGSLSNLPQGPAVPPHPGPPTAWAPPVSVVTSGCTIATARSSGRAVFPPNWDPPAPQTSSAHTLAAQVAALQQTLVMLPSVPRSQLLPLTPPLPPPTQLSQGRVSVKEVDLATLLDSYWQTNPPAAVPPPGTTSGRIVLSGAPPDRTVARQVLPQVFVEIDPNMLVLPRVIYRAEELRTRGTGGPEDRRTGGPEDRLGLYTEESQHHRKCSAAACSSSIDDQALSLSAASALEIRTLELDMSKQESISPGYFSEAYHILPEMLRWHLHVNGDTAARPLAREIGDMFAAHYEGMAWKLDFRTNFAAYVVYDMRIHQLYQLAWANFNPSHFQQRLFDNIVMDPHHTPTKTGTGATHVTRDLAATTPRLHCVTLLPQAIYLSKDQAGVWNRGPPLLLWLQPPEGLSQTLRRI